MAGVGEGIQQVFDQTQAQPGDPYAAAINASADVLAAINEYNDLASGSQLPLPPWPPPPPPLPPMPPSAPPPLPPYSFTTSAAFAPVVVGVALAAGLGLLLLLRERRQSSIPLRRAASRSASTEQSTEMPVAVAVVAAAATAGGASPPPVASAL